MTQDGPEVIIAAKRFACGRDEHNSTPMSSRSTMEGDVSMGTASAFRKTGCALSLGMALLLFPLMTSAKTVSYIKDYSYQASEADSKLSSRTIAMEQVKRLLLEELGTYVISVTEVKDFEVTKDKIITFTAGLVNTIVLEEKWDGRTYYLKAKISADTDELAKEIERVHRDQEQSMQLEAMRKRTDEALKEIEDLKKEMGKGKRDKATQEKYAQSVDILTAMDWVRKGIALKNNDYNLKEALKAFSKAIELDPKFAMAYAGRASIYYELQMDQEVLRDAEQAVKLDPNLAWGFNIRGAAYGNLRKFKEAMADLNRATELKPKYVWPYCNRSKTYFFMGKYDEALAEANKAIEIAPYESNGYFNKGRVLVALNQFKDAINNLDKAIELFPKPARYFYWRGEALMGNNETERGLEDIKKAARMGHNSARIYLERKGIRW